MIEPKTAVVELQSRLGRVGSIVAYDPWDSRKSVLHAKYWVSKIARLSHGLGEAEDFEAHFDRVVHQMKHESVLEFVPWTDCSALALPYASLRHRLPINDPNSPNFWLHYFAEAVSERGTRLSAASAFLVEAPIFVARQWMRHLSFAYLEMSRRYTKGSRVPLEFYGTKRMAMGTRTEDPTGNTWDYADGFSPELREGEKRVAREAPMGCSFGLSSPAFHMAVAEEYGRRLRAGWPQEIARGCLPVETMTRWWVAGFDRDWEAFLKLRDDAHAQPEIRTLASWISGYLKAKKEIAG